MSDNDLQTLLRTGIQAARNGNKQVARRIFEQVLEIDDHNELAWLWMASVVESARERRICLENVLNINPDNARARQALEKLDEAPPMETDEKPKAEARKPRRKREPRKEEIDLDARLSAQPPLPPAEDEIDLDARLGRAAPGTPEWGEGDWLSAAPASKAGAGKPGAGPRPTAEPLPTGAPPRRRRRARRLMIILIGGIVIIGIVAVAALLLRMQLGLGGILPEATSIPTVVEPTRIVIVAPGSATPVPTWTPPSTSTPAPTSTPRPTRTPLSSYTLAYSALGQSERNESIYTIRADSDPASRMQLTSDDAGSLSPSISPDGSRIAFISNQTGSPELYIVDTAGGEPTQLTNLGADNLESPSWSPDGRRIVLNANPEGNDELYVLDLETQQLVQLTDNPSTDREPAWSPDGKTIAFASDRAGRSYLQIYTVPADCNTLEGGCEVYAFRLTRSQNSSMSPAWSPDSRFIAFVSNRVTADDNDIYVMRDDGADPRLLTLDQYGDNGASDLNPSWSRDGQWIAFASDREGIGFQIYAMSADGTEVFQVTSQPGNALHPSWFPQ